MTKLEFLNEIRKGLSGLPLEEIEERVNFLSEMIDDLMEDGLSEKEAVAKMGSVDDIVSKAIADTPLSMIAKEKLKKERGISAFEITLIILAFPLWFPLLAAALSVIVALYASLWSVVVSLWAAFASFVSCFVGGTVSGIYFSVTGHPLIGVAMIGAGIFLAGLSIFAFFACKWATVLAVKIPKWIVSGIKYCFMKKEAAQ